MPAFLHDFGDFEPVTQQFIVPSLWFSLWTAMLNLGNAIGCLSVGYFIDRFGSKYTAWGTCVAAFAFISVQLTAHSRIQLLFGKLLNGIPQGMFIVVAANYLAEVSGIRIRASLLSMIPLFVLSGVTMGVGLGIRFLPNFADAWKSYRLLFARMWISATVCQSQRGLR